MNRTVASLKKTVKRISAAAAVAVLTVIAVLAIRTAICGSRQLHVQTLSKPALDQKRVVERLAQAIRFQTVSHRNATYNDAAQFLGLHEHLERSFPNVHAKLKREIVGEFSLLYVWEGSDSTRKPVLLMSHLDVVPVEPETEQMWTKPPFGGEIADGYLYGRGALDVKNGVLGILEGVELLLEQGFKPAATLYLAFGHDEEVGGAQGNAQIAKLLKARRIRFEYVLDEGGAIAHETIAGVSQPVALIGIAEKGYLSVELSVEQIGGHSSTPPPKTAIGILSSAIHRLETDPFPTKLDGPTGQMLDFLGPEMSLTNRMIMANRWLFGRSIKQKIATTPSGNAALRTTLAATSIQAGIQENVLPAHARAIINVRILPGDGVNSVLSRMRKTIADGRVRIRELDSTRSFGPSAESSIDTKAFATIQRTIHQVFPDVVVAPFLSIHATDSRHYAPLADNIFRFIPFRIRPADIERIHGLNERISVENYVEIIHFFAALIRNSCS